MSKEKKEKQIDNEEVKDEKPTKEPTIVELKMAQVISERDDFMRKLNEACDTIEDLKKKLANAEDAIMEDVKAGIVSEIHPKVSLSQKALSFKSLDELMAMKKVLDVSNMPAFQAGTPLYYGDKKSPREQLADTFKNNMKKLKGDKF